MEMVDKATEKRWKRKMGRLLWIRRLYSPWFLLVYYWFWRTLFRLGEAFIPEKQLSGRRKEAGDRRKQPVFCGRQPG